MQVISQKLLRKVGPIEDIAEETEKKKLFKNKSGRSKVDKITSKSRVDAYMEQRMHKS